MTATLKSRLASLGASLMPTYLGLNKGPVGRPEFFSIALVIWFATLSLHLGDPAQAMMDMYVFGIFTVLMWCLYRKPDASYRAYWLLPLSLFGFIALAVTANVTYINTAPQPNEPIYYHLAAFSSLDGPAFLFVVYSLALRRATMTLGILSITLLLAVVGIASPPVTDYLLQHPEHINAWGMTNGTLTLITALVTTSFMLRCAALALNRFCAKRQIAHPEADATA